MLRYYGIIKELVDSNTQFNSELIKKLKNSLTSFDINAYLYIIREYKHPKYIFEKVFHFSISFPAFTIWQFGRVPLLGCTATQLKKKTEKKKQLKKNN